MDLRCVNILVGLFTWSYDGIIFIPYCKIKWFHLYSVIPIQETIKFPVCDH